jgi:hypothetical protein
MYWVHFFVCAPTSDFPLCSLIFGQTRELEEREAAMFHTAGPIVLEDECVCCLFVAPFLNKLNNVLTAPTGWT